MNNLVTKLKGFIQQLNSSGVPLPLFKINGKPTLTGTMAVLSFTTAWLGQLGKIANVLGEVDLSQANYLVIICLGAYLGRNLQKDGNKVTLEQSKDDNETSK